MKEKDGTHKETAEWIKRSYSDVAEWINEPSLRLFVGLVVPLLRFSTQYINNDDR